MVTSYITTIKERCRMCYTCVRECPAKAIRIADGQAEVIGERCIACGNCVRVCSQHAKQVRSTIDEVRRAADVRAAAWRPAWRPAFPPSSPTSTYAQLVGMLRALGFDLVLEVASAPTWWPREYRQLLADDQRPPLHRHHLPGDHRLRRAVLSRPGRLAGSDRLADGRHGPGAAAAARRRPEDRLHRPLHRQEGRGREPRRSPARSTRC